MKKIAILTSLRRQLKGIKQGRSDSIVEEKRTERGGLVRVVSGKKMTRAVGKNEASNQVPKSLGFVRRQVLVFHRGGE